MSTELHKSPPQFTRRQEVEISVADVKREVSDVFVESDHFLLWIWLHVTEQNPLDNL